MKCGRIYTNFETVPTKKMNYAPLLKHQGLSLNKWVSHAVAGVDFYEKWNYI